MAAKYRLCPKCKYRYERIKKKCPSCGKARPKKRSGPKHAAVLREMPYEAGWPEFSVSVHGGHLHHCAVCGRAPTKVKRHDRDHDHRTGQPRGVCCSYCNRERLRGIADVNEARMVLAYFERVHNHYTKPEGNVEEGKDQG